MKIATVCYADKTSHFSVGQEVERVSAGALSDYVLTAYKCLLIHVDYDNNDDHDDDDGLGDVDDNDDGVEVDESSATGGASCKVDYLF